MMSKSSGTFGHWSGRRSFTLLEMLIAIGIVVFLAGLTLAVGSTLLERSEIQKTSTTLALLDTALQEWERAADRKLAWTDSDSSDIQSPEGDENYYPLILVEVLDTIRRQPDVRNILAKINPSLVYTFKDGELPDWLSLQVYIGADGESLDGKITILDPWGSPIYATHPGSLFDPSTPEASQTGEPDPDGTIRTMNESDFGIVARDRRVCFVSAGPDGLFGIDAEYPPTGDFSELIAKHRLDNIYSYPVDVN